MNDSERSPLLRLLSPESYPRKKKRPTFPTPPARVETTHEQHLRRGIAELLKHNQETIQHAPELATDTPYLRFQLVSKSIVSDAELSSLGLVAGLRSGLMIEHQGLNIEVLTSELPG